MPEEYLYLSLCLEHCPEYWRNLNEIHNDLELESHRDHVVRSLVSMVTAHTEVVDMYWNGHLRKEEHSVPPRSLHTSGTMNWNLRQSQIIEELKWSISKCLRYRHHDEDEDEPQRCSTNLFAILGPASCGKSALTQSLVSDTIQCGGRVLITAPTGMLASVIRQDFPQVDVDTIHAAFLLHMPFYDSLMVLREYDYVIVEEVGQITGQIFDRILSVCNVVDQESVLVFVGDFYQLRDVPQNNIVPTRAFDSHRWADVTKKYLTEMVRCKCALLGEKNKTAANKQANQNSISENCSWPQSAK